MSSHAIVCLGRFGDVVAGLPLAYAMALDGHQVHWYIETQFASILEPCSYIIPHPLPIATAQVTMAVREANKGGHDKVLVAQVEGNPNICPVECENFTLKQWAHAGIEWLDRYHDYRPLFDRRDYRAEAEAAKRLPPDDGRPLFLCNFNGHSSPYGNVTSQWTWAFAEFSKQYRVFDLSGVKLDKPHHLLGLLDRADVLLTTDTLHLHLANATQTPTIQMSAGVTPQGRPSRFYDSEPRNHVIHKCSYAESVTPLGRAAIARILREKDFELGRYVRDVGPLCRGSMKLGGRMIHHVTNWYTGNAKDNPRVFRARATWEELRIDPDYRIIEHSIKPGDRTSADLGDTRTLPYIKDIVDAGCKGADDKDIVVFSNSDVSLVPEALYEIRRKMEHMPCCYSRRIDVPDNSARRKLKDNVRAVVHVGADLFAFEVGFWKQHKDDLPDVFLSCEGWDAVARFFCRKHSKFPEIEVPIIWHQQHQSWWALNENIRDNVAQIHNRSECIKWSYANGCDAALYGDKSKFVFKPDDAWMGRKVVSI